MGESRGASGFLAYANELAVLPFARGALQRRGGCGRAERARSPRLLSGHTHLAALKAKGGSLWAAEQVRPPAQKVPSQFKFLLQKPKRTREIT